MLEIKPVCENCCKSLPNTSDEAMICSFECTFCIECVDNVLFNVCPNCGGGFEKRPTRPADKLERFPTAETEYIKPVDIEQFDGMLKRYYDTDPRKR